MVKDIARVRTLLYDYLRGMNYLSTDLKIQDFDKNTGGQYTINGEFNEFLGDKVIFRAIYNEMLHEVTSFQIVAKKPKRDS